MPGQPVAAALAEAAKAMDSKNTLKETLDAIAGAAKVSVPGFDEATVTVWHGDGKFETMAGTDELVWDLDALQYHLGEGPCVEAIKQGGDYEIEDMARERRWPQYVRGAKALGVRAQMGIEIHNDGKEVAGLNLYSTKGETIDPDAVSAAELFVAHAALALGHARETDNLQTALATRKVIGQAMGMVMERYKVGEDRAFQFLVRVSSTSNTKLRDVAQELVDEANQSAEQAEQSG